ncbi:MAG: YdeI/OmpD-associated family protein [Polyangiaceae bacterium]|nr:YdeI/OmpD-associated family protein [Polyangiaceae bacterium]
MKRGRLFDSSRNPPSNEKQGSAIVPGAAKKAAPQKRVIPPADLVVALGTNDAATATWKTLAPSHIKEYVLWIEDAKRPETRARRVEQTITMLAAGVRNRNEKYAGK